MARNETENKVGVAGGEQRSNGRSAVFKSPKSPLPSLLCCYQNAPQQDTISESTSFFTS